MDIFLIVDENLEKLEKLPCHTSTFHFFESIKSLEGCYQPNEPFGKNWLGVSAPPFEIGYDATVALLDSKIRLVQAEAKGKMVIHFQDAEANYRRLYQSLYSPTQLDATQEAFNEIKKSATLKGCTINSLEYYLNIVFRKLMIKGFYLSEIYPKISKPILELNNTYIPYENKFHHIRFGYGFLSYRKKVLEHFRNAEALFWIKLLNTAKTKQITQENFKDSADTRIFYGSEPDISYIDIFTNQDSVSHLLRLLTSEDDRAFCVNIKTLVNQLRDKNLLYAYEQYSK